VSLGTIVSAFFILTANTWMQHPVSYRIVGGKAELTDFWVVLRNSTLRRHADPADMHIMTSGLATCVASA
jgi:cytochrome bd ubiquinol oxidase subunit I